MFSILGAIVAIGLLIIVHEGGHYLVAKWCKMRVDRFSVGFGPALLKWRHKGTDFVVAPIPFGGYVQINGMNLADEVDDDDPQAYPNRPVWQRFLTIFAGPGTNYLFAAVLAFVLYAVAGSPGATSMYQVVETTPGYDAHGKLMRGDKLVKINERLVFASYDEDERHRLSEQARADVGQMIPVIVHEEMQANGATVDITVLRDGDEVVVPIEPQLWDPEVEHPMFAAVQQACGEECKEFHLGVTLGGSAQREPIGIASAAQAAIVYPVRQTQVIVDNLVMWARGEVEGELTGPVGITTAVKQHFDFGWVRVCEVLMMLNVYLGLFNLLPLPALDGGRLAFLGYEMATRRRANPKIEATVHMVGIMALLLLMLFVTYRDIARLFG